MILEGFPGKLEKVRNAANGFKYIPTHEQVEWILQQFANKDIRLADIVETVGSSELWVKTLCYSNGLHRSPGRKEKKISRLVQLKADYAKRQKDLIHKPSQFVPDKQLLMLHREDEEQSTIGHCIGTLCVNYHTEGCYHQVKNPVTGRLQRQHLTECNAIF